MPGLLTEQDLPLRPASPTQSSLGSAADLDHCSSLGSVESRPGSPAGVVQVIRALWSDSTVQMSAVPDADLPCLARIVKRRPVHDDDEGADRRVYTTGRGVCDVTGSPLLLYAMHKCSKVLGVPVRRDPETKQLVESGPRLAIPVNYRGWFQFVEGDNTSVHALGSVEEVAQAGLREFVTHESLTAYRYCKRSEEGDRLYVRQTVPAGEVLTTKNVLTEWLSQESVKQSKSCFCFSKPKPRAADGQGSYLKCRDSCGRRLLLPFQTAGRFSEVGQKGAEVDHNASYQLTDIARWTQLPVTLKLVCGDTPGCLGEEFSGLVRLDELLFESSLIASSLGVRKGQQHQLVEFPETSDIQVVRCQNWAELETTDAVESAMAHCGEQYESFTHSAKVISDVDTDSKAAAEPSETDTMLAQVRALPPTPQLPKVAKRRRSRAWMWAKSIINKRRLSGKASDSVSEDSDYEVIPFYLRSVTNNLTEEEGQEVFDETDTKISHVEDNVTESKTGEDQEESDEVQQAAGEEHNDQEQRKDTNDLYRSDSSRCDNDSIPNTRPKVTTTLLPQFRDKKPEDGSHDEDGYLLPLEIRDRTLPKASSPCVPGPGSIDRYTSSHSSSVMDTCSSATVTRDTDGSLNKSTETLLAPPSAGTVRSYTNNATEADYAPAKFDHQRLDAFLADSIHELHRRQSREVLVEIRDKRGLVPPRDLHPPPLAETSAYLDKMFECDSSVEKDSHSSGFVADSSLPPVRSMSVPDGVFARPADPRLYRPSLPGEYGYQTLDSGIWLSPRSAVSDPYRDSATYRSTSDCSWVPPEQVQALTVEEVGLSLRYIGMKEHIVTRFCEEQIDGHQLVELDEGLLTEGFPDLNALDRKKLLDFIKGWRPRKWGTIHMD